MDITEKFFNGQLFVMTNFDCTFNYNVLLLHTNIISQKKDNPKMKVLVCVNAFCHSKMRFGKGPETIVTISERRLQPQIWKQKWFYSDEGQREHFRQL